MTRSKLLVLLTLSLSVASCALKGSKAEAKYEGKSNCTQSGFTCGPNVTGQTDGLMPSADPDSQNFNPSFTGRNNYAPICRLKNDKCQCSCEPVN